MKRISFKDSGGLNLTQAVLSGLKTMTRRAVPYRIETDAMKYAEGKSIYTRAKFEYVCQNSPYKIGDVVAVQQSYKDLDEEVDLYKFLHMDNIHERFSEECKMHKGWTNKMFVKAELMHNHIRITSVCVERLQLIPYEDCLREGVYRDVDGGKVIGYPFGVPFYYTFTGAISKDGKNLHWATPREAFTALIDKVSGRGTWESNPLVWVYSFELVD